MSRALDPWDLSPERQMMKLLAWSAVLTALIVAVCLLPGCQAQAQWGTRCAPVGRGTPYPVVSQPTSPASFTAGRPCSTLCTCGCNAEGPCPCKGLPAPVQTSAPASEPAVNSGGGEFTLTDPPYNGGLIMERLRASSPERLYHGSVSVDLDGLIQAIENVPDYRAKPRLTVIGSEAARARVRADAKAVGLSDLFLFSDRPPDHWHNRDRDGKPAFRTDGDPTLTVQAPDGRVLHSQAGYGGPAELAALRKAHPDYDPSKDPDVRKPAPKPPVPPSAPFDWSTLAPWAVPAVLAALALVLVLPPSRNPCNSRN